MTMLSPTGVGSKPAGHSPGLANWVAQHEIPLFFLLTFVFSWSIYGIISLIHISNDTVLSRWLLVAAFGPSFTAVVLSRIRDPEREQAKTIQQLFLFAAMLLVGTAVEYLDHNWWYHKIQPSLIVADVILIFLAAFVVSSSFSSRRGVRNLLQGLFRWHIHIGWYIVAVGLWPVLVLTANMLAETIGLSVPTAPFHPTVIPMLALVLESFIWYLLLGGPLNEEVGWRALGQVKLQHRLSPLMASLVIGFFWGLWHVPVHAMGMYPMGLQGALIRIFDLPKAVLFTWLFNRTNRSLLPVLFLHAAINTTSLFLARNYITSALLLLVLAVILVFTDQMWRLSTPDQLREET